jgi:hypothetical protein
MPSGELRAPWARIVANLEAEKARVESRLEQAAGIPAWLDSLPEGDMEVLEEIGRDPDAPFAENDQRTQFDRIRDYLREELEPKTIAEIEEATGIPRVSISAVIYRTHATEFASSNGNGRAKGWRMLSEVAAELIPDSSPPLCEENIPF